jgi:hypothetical protein
MMTSRACVKAQVCLSARSIFKLLSFRQSLVEGRSSPKILHTTLVVGSRRQSRLPAAQVRDPGRRYYLRREADAR